MRRMQGGAFPIERETKGAHQLRICAQCAACLVRSNPHAPLEGAIEQQVPVEWSPPRMKLFAISPIGPKLRML
jgi:hypothetical protein